MVVNVKIQLVRPAHPCQACQITANLQEEVLAKLCGKHGGLVFEVVEFGTPAEMKAVENLEVEKFPAVIADGEQITAGSLYHLRRLERVLGLEDRQG